MNYRHNTPLRFSRTMGEAFPHTADYGAAITKPWPGFWKRFFKSLREAYFG